MNRKTGSKGLSQGRKKLNRIYKHIKTYQFKQGALHGWAYRSFILKHGADRLYDHYHNAKVRKINRSFKEFEKDHVSVDGARKLAGEELQDEWDFQLISIYYLLIGFAVENLLKGILLIRDPEKYFDSESKKLKNLDHDLIELCVTKCEITINQAEEKLLKELYTQVIWKGRYPTPFKEAKMEVYQPSDTPVQAIIEKVESRKTQEEVDALYTKIYNEFKAAKLSKK